MDVNVSPLLPWDRMVSADPEIPWDVLEQFARALPGHGQVLERLLELYEHFERAPYERSSYEGIYIPAIFAKAAADLPSDAKLRLAHRMVLSLAVSEEADDAVMSDVLVIAVASMGPDAALTAVLEFAAKEPNSCPGAYGLWHLLVLAKDTHDTNLRDRAIQLCLQALEMAKADQMSVDNAEPAAWILGRMKHLPARHLIQRLYVKTQRPEFLESLELLDGKAQWSDQDDPWNAPFEECVQENCDFLRDWYLNGDEENPDDLDGPDDGLDDEDDDEDFDDEEARDAEVMKRAVALIEEFHDSKFLVNAGQAREDYCFDIQSVLEYAWRYEGAEAKDLTKSVLHELLLDVLPRKVTAERDYFERLAPAVLLFLEFLEAKGVLGDTARMRQAVDKWRDEIVRRGMDPKNWGPAKTFAMAALQAGVDLGDEKAMNRFLMKYNATMMEQHRAGGGAGGLNLGLADRLLAIGGYQGEDDDLGEPVAAPIVNDGPKVGRNDPCPCGSGKKFKKCCGSSARP